MPKGQSTQIGLPRGIGKVPFLPDELRKQIDDAMRDLISKVESARRWIAPPPPNGKPRTSRARTPSKKKVKNVPK